MKKMFAISIVLIMAVLLLAACGGAGDYSYTVAEAPQAMIAPTSPPVPSPAYDMEMGEFGEIASHRRNADYLDYYDEESMAFAMPVTLSRPEEDYEESGNVPEGVMPGMAEKIIYTAFAEVETTEFEETIDMVTRLIAQNGAFVEDSYVRNTNLTQRQGYGYSSLRYANYTLRVPQNRLIPMTESLDQLGNVVSIQNNATNITAQFVDTESQLTALRIQEASLLSMLAKAETVADMIIIEERLSDVRYQIESLTSTLRNWQTQIDYSTLTLNIQEVEKYTEPVIINQTYWERIGNGLGNTMMGIGEFFTGLFAWLIIYLPVFIILAVITVGIIIIVRRADKRIKKKNEAKAIIYAANNANYTQAVPPVSAMPYVAPPTGAMPQAAPQNAPPAETVPPVNAMPETSDAPQAAPTDGNSGLEGK